MGIDLFYPYKQWRFIMSNGIKICPLCGHDLNCEYRDDNLSIKFGDSDEPHKALGLIDCSNCGEFSITQSAAKNRILKFQRKELKPLDANEIKHIRNVLSGITKKEEKLYPLIHHNSDKATINQHEDAEIYYTPIAISNLFKTDE